MPRGHPSGEEFALHIGGKIGHNIVIGHRPGSDIARTVAANAFGLQQGRNLRCVGDVAEPGFQGNGAASRHALARGNRLSRQEVDQRV